ncbi:hypothetical protein CNMCM5623_009374 [Aspergillus felis]|uniref:DUF4246 domain-containing protein n=1 Tax=Aspergillus felis TaxID=1287682 RepID=A0A8H6Q3F5_9EURO|nr:hypothetical protein CNMCM5623_009374 [Aspergillus felis]
MAYAQSRFDLPGFSLPLDYTPGRTVMFPQWPGRLLHLVFNDEIIAKWRKEIQDSGEDVSEPMLEWIIKEAQWKAEVFQDTRHVVAFDVGVVKSDVAISEELRQALIEAVRPLEEIPKEQKDYHPGTDNKVVDLVHPSLFPLIYGRTRILPDQLISLEAFADHLGEGKVLPVRPEVESLPAQSSDNYRFDRPPHRPYSLRFQWLPCDVHFGPNDDDGCRIASYINNLHPKRHRALYQVIEKILTRTIPMWNTTLRLLQDEYKRIDYYEVEYEDHPEPEPAAANEDEEYTPEFRERYAQWERRQPIKLPEPGSFVPHTIKSQLDLHHHYAERGLQVIVKLANIELTPEKPEYEGGSWHIEGQLNEHICATAIYYYDSENITESTLAFRQRASTDEVVDIAYEQSRHGFLQQVFGFGPDVDGWGVSNVTQLLGSVETRQGRLLTFPNNLQHRVAPSGWQTPNVPPQQEDWWRERQELVARLLAERPTAELLEMLRKGFDAQPITMEEAKQYRKELMEERSSKLEAQNERFEKDSFNLCEH